MDPLDLAGYLRYGVPTSQKEALARQGVLPGAPKDTSADQDKADRYAAGYLFSRYWPQVAQAVQPYINLVKTSDLPFFGGSSPELQSYAQQGTNMGAMTQDSLQQVIDRYQRSK